MKELSNRLGNRPDMKMSRFRPSIVVKTDDDKPFQEDRWTNLVRFGSSATLRFARYCNRCPFTMIDPDSGVMGKDGEPLKTLRTFRKVETIAPSLTHQRSYIKDSPVFGTDFGLANAGEFKVGDEVFVGEYV